MTVRRDADRAVVADAAPLRGGGPGADGAASRRPAVLVLLHEHDVARHGLQPSAAQLLQHQCGAQDWQWPWRVLVLERAVI